MFFNSIELNQISLEGVLIVVIALITLNLLFIGFYILSVLRELKKTLTRARGMMEEVDRSVKTGMDKFIAIERPLEALSTTTNALAGFLKGAGAIKKATQSILNSGESGVKKTTATAVDAKVEAAASNDEESSMPTVKIKTAETVIETEPVTPAEKKSHKKPKFFK